MRRKTKNHQNQGSIDKKFDFFPQSPTHIPRWVHLVQKTRAKNSYAWAPLSCQQSYIAPIVAGVVDTCGKFAAGVVDTDGTP